MSEGVALHCPPEYLCKIEPAWSAVEYVVFFAGVLAVVVLVLVAFTWLLGRIR